MVSAWARWLVCNYAALYATNCDAHILSVRTVDSSSLMDWTAKVSFHSPTESASLGHL